MLRKTRRILAVLFLAGITLLFLDFTGAVHTWLGWMAKIQFLPALLALNAGVVVFLLVLTLLFGRVYCSVICPLGVMQDAIARMGRWKKRNPYSYSPALSAVRYTVLALFVIATVAGIGSLTALLAPYSAYGRIATNFFAPLYRWGNNGLAYLAERADSYAFYETEVWLRSLPAFLLAAATLIIIGILAWKNGRTYCNAICPVGTVLGFVSRYAWLKPTIDTSKCIGCNLCARNCKAACIDAKHHRIDYSRCVACMDCIGACREGAIRYTHARPDKETARENAANPAPPHKKTAAQPADNARRTFLSSSLLLASAVALKAQKKKVDGGLAPILDKKAPPRQQYILPPGAYSARHFAQHCTACQLCVSACPNGVLSPSSDLLRFMQPEMSYERGYCRPECARCAEVCPTDAIHLTDLAEKTSTQIGHAVWIKANCIPLTDGVECGNCARHCPTAAIQMIPSEAGNPDSLKIPAVNTERCIGCGACENLCPARPFSAIYVEGHTMHRTI